MKRYIKKTTIITSNIMKTIIRKLFLGSLTIPRYTSQSSVLGMIRRGVLRFYSGLSTVLFVEVLAKVEMIHRVSMALALFLSIIPLASNLFANTNESNRFVESFLDCYDFSVVGRNTHEYHNLLLEKSSLSLDELEDEIEKNNMNIRGRIVLTGYEEQSIPAFYTSYKDCTGSKINDEAYVKTKSDWSTQLHNKFGLMTGFLFKDCNTIKKDYLPNEDLPFEHIDSDLVYIYDNDSYFFQKHSKAFGDLLKPMQYKKQNIDYLLLKKKYKDVFPELINFWRSMYEYEILHGNQNVMGTQDILFSISHAQHLMRSKVDLIKYYFGPDITYPIKVTKKQKKPATKHAQEFVKRFIKNLNPINEEPTVYVFCSFVDGVGKSTLLGNIINHQNHQTDFESYKPVDNTSSQLADIYEFGKNVFIADLPAQVSHFTYKPDGMVYIDIQTLKTPEKEIKKLRELVSREEESFIKNHEYLKEKVQKTIGQNDWFAQELNDKNQPEKAFIKNTILLKKESPWITFKFENRNYIFDINNPANIRILCDLEKSDSTGLKNINPDQMLFFYGVRFPISYKLFVQNLIDELQKIGIKNVVLVDFLSMYPRSSRENIRVNYLLQQLAILYDDFEIEKSLYGTFNNDAQLFANLKLDKHKKMLDTLQKETVLRLALLNIINRKNYSSISGVPIYDVTKIAQEEIDKLDAETIKLIEQKSREKVSISLSRLEKIHGLTKNFVNIQQLDFDEIIKLSKKLKQIFTQRVECKNLNELWNLNGKIVAITKDNIIKTNKGEQAELLFLVSPECKNENILAPILRAIRASWYSSLLNLLEGKINDSGKIELEKEKYLIPPVLIKKTINGKIAVVRKIIEKIDLEYIALEYIANEDKRKFQTSIQETTSKLLKLSKNIDTIWGKYNEQYYLLNPEKSKTDFGILSFGYNSHSEEERFIKNPKNDTSKIITTEEVWEKMKEDPFLESDRKHLLEQIKQGAKNKESHYAKNYKKSEKKNYYIYRLVFRAIATLEILAKDTNSKIVIRPGNKEDFSAALQIFENGPNSEITTGFYENFKLVFEKRLFHDYHSVKPIIKLECWK